MAISTVHRLTSILCLIVSAVACAKGPIIDTTSGTVRGYYPDAATRAFLGIPYAQPPLGSLRFKPPQPIKEKAKGVIDATEFGLSCYQQRTAVAGATSLTPTTGESEDCLTLNIWGSAEPSRRLKPVFVFMYGGGFTEGSSSVPCKPPTVLARGCLLTKKQFIMDTTWSRPIRISWLYRSSKSRNACNAIDKANKSLATE